MNKTVKSKITNTEKNTCILKLIETILCLNSPCKTAVAHFHVRATALKDCSLAMKQTIWKAEKQP